jgi:putative hemolysin
MKSTEQPDLQNAGALRQWPLARTSGHYRVRLAASEIERTAVFRLRFRVFCSELGEGSPEAYRTQLEEDVFDAFSDHLIVEHTVSGIIVGTYRLQRQSVAKANLGFYCQREFDFSPYEPLGAQLLELGRACVDREHRQREVLDLLWSGIASYAQHYDMRYLIGCSSLTSQDPSHGMAVFEKLKKYLVDPPLRTKPLPAYELPPAVCGPSEAKIPRLLLAYLAVGAKICGPPALDREFKTIDFLTFSDLAALPPHVRARFFSSER